MRSRPTFNLTKTALRSQSQQVGRRSSLALKERARIYRAALYWRVNLEIAERPLICSLCYTRTPVRRQVFFILNYTDYNRSVMEWRMSFIQIELNVQYVANMVDIFKTSSIPHVTCAMAIVLWHVSHIMWPFPSSNFILSYFILSNFISNFSYCIFLYIFCK